MAMTRREMMHGAAVLGGAALLGSNVQAAPQPDAKIGPLPGWSCEFKLHRSEATSLIVNGQLWCRHVENDLGHTWVLPEGEVIVPFPEKYRYQKEINLVGVSSPWGDESLIHICWNGVLKKRMEFGKYDEKQLNH
jgi:hypothetical protein